MATYIKGVTDYIPVLEAFKPDYKFLSDVLTVRQDRYDTNYKQLNNLYSKVVHAPLSREDNQEQRDQYANTLSNGLKQVSGLDLSLQQNADVAKGLFKPFFEDKAVVKDMAFTKVYQKEMQLANDFMTSSVDKQRDKFWQIGVQDLKYQMDDFKNKDASYASSAPMPSYVENPNIYERSFESLKDSGLKIKQTTLEGDWIITTQNGTALTRQIVGYEKGENGKLDPNKPIIRNPAAEHLKYTVMKDPIVTRGLLTEAKVKGRQFSEDPANIQKYGSSEKALEFWANKIIKDQTNKEIKQLAEVEQEVKSETIAARNWESYKKRHGIIPGTPEDEMFLKSMFNKKLVTQNRDDLKSRVVSQKGPASDMNQLLNKAYASYMGSVMGPKMSQAAIAYSQIDAEQTFEANPFKKMEYQHRFDLNKMAIQYQYDIGKIQAKHVADIELQKLKNSSVTTGSDMANLLGITGGMLVEGGDGRISGSLTGVDMDNDGNIDDDERSYVDTFLENQNDLNQLLTEVDQGDVRLIESLIVSNSNDMKGVAGYQGDGQIKYTYYPDGSSDGVEKTADIATAFRELTDQNNAGYKRNATEFGRIVSNVRSKYEDIINLEDGSSLNYSLANLNMDPNSAAQIHELYNSTLKARARLNEKVEEMNSIYKTVQDYQITASPEVFEGGSHGTVKNSKPPILLTQGEIDMLNKGVMWHDVKYASENGNLTEPVVDGAGTPVRRKVSKEEYQTIYANMLHLQENQRNQLNSGSGDRDDYDFLTYEPGFFNDYETLAEEYWDYDKDYTTYHPEGAFHHKGKGWVFNREYALEQGAESYDAIEKGLKTIMSAEGAVDRNHTYDLRAEVIGQEITGAPGETMFNQYSTVFDPAAPSEVSTNQLKALIWSEANTLDQNILKTISIGDNRHRTTTEIGTGADGNYDNVIAGQIYKKYIQSLVTDKIDKTQGRPYVGLSYIEKVSGPEQDDNQRVAGYHLNFGPDYAKTFKDMFGTGSDFNGKGYADFLKNGITITIPQDKDNNPYKSTNQLLSFTDLAIKDNGNYKSTPILNGGHYTIYKNSNEQYVQEVTTFSFDEETGGMPANKLTSIVLPVDPGQLDMLVINMDQRLFELQRENLNKKALWNKKNKKKIKTESNNAQ
jgi:hypothetical protein